ncbi:MAG TPA: heavy metal translocating P-type ATPase, partial [Micrococcaceae bacterium]
MTFVHRYPTVAATVLAGVAVAVLLIAGQPTAARGLASIFALAVAAYKTVGMVRDIVHGRWGIDLLAVMAILSTVAIGEYIASLIIVLMLTGGEALEDFAAGRARRELSALLARAPQIAHREQSTGAARDQAARDILVEDIPVGEVRVGDVLLVRPSEVVPVDGLLLSPAGSFDESALTGESLPVERTEGDPVLSGSVNGEAATRIRVAALLQDSQYSRIVALVREASASRAPVVRLADRYAVPFTLLALALAGAAWALSSDPARFAEVLVVATPCPLLIAAPVAFLGGMSRAAHAGIIVKNGGTLEVLARIRTAAFDKTGTLTHGRPALQEIRTVQATRAAAGREELLQLAASAEQYSSHVLAGSVVEAARSRGLALLAASEASEHATQGVTAVLAGRTVVVGKRSFVAAVAEAAVEGAALSSGQLAVYVSVDGRFAGTLVMSDPLRGNARATLAELRRLGVGESLILTGDAQATADHIAAEVGITRVQAECLPAEKVAAVASLPRRPVMMVGDGVNDAPVLAAADVGVAMGAKGSTAASESADV